MTTGPALTDDEAAAILDRLRVLAGTGNTTAAAYVAVLDRAAAVASALADALPVVYRQVRELAAITAAVAAALKPDDDEGRPFGDVPPFDALQLLVKRPPQPTITPEPAVSTPSATGGPETWAGSPEAWDYLASWLDHPANSPAAPAGNGGTIRQLETLEALAVQAGLWEPGHLDRLASTLLELDPPGLWRAEVLNLDNLRRFAKRALLEAHAHVDADPRGKAARARRRDHLGRGPDEADPLDAAYYTQRAADDKAAAYRTWDPEGGPL